MGRDVELLRVDVGHRGANHHDEGSRGSAFGMLQASGTSIRLGESTYIHMLMVRETMEE